MKNRKNIFFVVLMFVLITVLAGNAFAGDKEDVQALINSTAETFNKHDFKAYFSYFIDDNTEFPYVVSPLRHDAAMWKAFIEGTGSLAYVNYHGQDFQIQMKMFPYLTCPVSVLPNRI